MAVIQGFRRKFAYQKKQTKNPKIKETAWSFLDIFIDKM